MRALVALAIAPLVLAAIEPCAGAQSSVAAQGLFDEGKELMSQGHYVEACAKFAESERLDPGVGTLFHLAECRERTGSLAAAWTTYLQVASEASALGQPARALAARDRAAAVEPKLARITIDPGAEKGAPGLEIVRDGVVLEPAEWGTAIPVDPGRHEVAVHARAKKAWGATVDAGRGVTTVVIVPALADLPVDTASARPVSAGTTTTTAAEVPTGGGRGNGQRAAGVAIGILGLAGIGAGTYLGLISLRDHTDADSHCGAKGCDATGVSLRNDARVAGTGATIAFAVGGGVLAIGLITFATAPRSAPSISLGVRPDGVTLRGTF